MVANKQTEQEIKTEVLRMTEEVMPNLSVIVAESLRLSHLIQLQSDNQAERVQV